MKTKETAIEWLFNKMNEIRIEDECNNISAIEFFNLQFKVFEQAKEMEEDQIVFAWEDGFWEGCEEKLRDYSAQDYYKRNYGTPQ